MKIQTAIILLLNTLICPSKVLKIGTAGPFTTLKSAAQKAVPGDTLFFQKGTHSGGQYISDLSGAKNAPIIIKANQQDSVQIFGGGNAWHFSNARFIQIHNITFYGQTQNGVNIDDGGTFETPSHHIEFHHCTFRDIAASGNNDLLKLSGLDDFVIQNCVFKNGSQGTQGSGIDMVGCHNGRILSNTFENMGGNAIQAKGGTQNIDMARNFFKNCGERSINLGGSTGLPYFRPQNAKFEAAYLRVYGNVFIGSTAPLAFVGCRDVTVVNNTILYPKKWVFRILQETVNPKRFVETGDNKFSNNLLVLENGLSPPINIGPNTRPQTFVLQNNLWYSTANAGWRPGFPPRIQEHNGIYQKDPVFYQLKRNQYLARMAVDDVEYLALESESPARGAGIKPDISIVDFFGIPLPANPNIGAVQMTTNSMIKRNGRHFPFNRVGFSFGSSGKYYDIMGRYGRWRYDMPFLTYKTN